MPQLDFVGFHYFLFILFLAFLLGYIVALNTPLRRLFFTSYLSKLKKKIIFFFTFELIYRYNNRGLTFSKRLTVLGGVDCNALFGFVYNLSDYVDLFFTFGVIPIFLYLVMSTNPGDSRDTRLDCPNASYFKRFSMFLDHRFRAESPGSRRPSSSDGRIMSMIGRNIGRGFLLMCFMQCSIWH
jgi:hypothetical protein